MTNYFYVSDFGAIAGDARDDTQAIQAALDAAAKAGGGTVVLSSGQYEVTGNGDAADGCLHVGSNVTLTGAGMASSGNGTTLHLMDGSDDDINGIVRTISGEVTEHATFSNFTIDGNRDQTSGDVYGFFCGVSPDDTRFDDYIMVDSIEIRDCSGYGFDPHEQTHHLTIQNSIAHGNGIDGFVADYIVDSVYRNNIAYDNDRHGFNITTSSHDMLLEDNVAYDNDRSGLIIQRNNFEGPWPADNIVSGGSYYNNKEDGITIKMGEGTRISGVESHDNGRYGVYLWGADDSVVSESSIYNNAQNGNYDEIRIARYDDSNGYSGEIYTARDNVIDDNLIYSDGSARYGVNEIAGGATHTQVTGNEIYGAQRGSIYLSDSTSFASGFDAEGTIAYGGRLITGGSHDDTLIGTSGNDRIYGGEGSDQLTGAAGADAMIGGGGDDVYYVDNRSDTVMELSNGGADSIFSSVDFTLAYHNENLTLTDSAVRGKGNSMNNSITGNSADNSLISGSGDDMLYGMDGNDYLSGGRGTDMLYGGSGKDNMKGGDGNDILVGGAGVDKLYGDAGADLFSYLQIDDSPLGGRDIISGFSRSSGDKIDFSALGTFDFVGINEFSDNGQGQVDYHYSGTKTVINVDVDGNGHADMEIALVGKIELTESDFVLA